LGSIRSLERHGKEEERGAGGLMGYNLIMATS
jgi:hypothetical protein